MGNGKKKLLLWLMTMVISMSMKILHVISQTPDHTGSGKYIQAVMNCAASKGYENHLVAGIQDDFCLDDSILPRNRACYVKFRSGNINFPLPGMSDVMPYPSTVFSTMTSLELKHYDAAFETAIRNAVHTFRPDIIHSHHLWRVSAITRRCFPGIPMVTTCHGTCLRQACLCSHLDWEEKNQLGKIDGIMALSQSQALDISRAHAIPPHRIHVVGGGFNQQLFYWKNKTIHDHVEILYAGKLSRAKGVPWLLRSLGRMNCRSIRLHLAGGGSGREKQLCLDLAETLGDRVVVHGALDHWALAELMRRCHVFVLPSFYEGLPLVLMEALASGCRLVTTALAGTLEVIGKTSSPLITLLELPVLETIDKPFKQDEEGLERRLAEALEKMANTVVDAPSPDRTAIEELTGRFTWDNVFSRIDSVYRKILS